jgi:sugar-specific transcriptional regulator TrmB
MTIELLEARKRELQAQQAQFVANANAINGAIQNCDWMIAELKKEAEISPTPAA